MSTPDANGWFDMPAPEDGTRVLFHDPRYGMREGNQPKGHAPGSWTFKVFSKRKAWWIGTDFSREYVPTKWCVLPKPPVSL